MACKLLIFVLLCFTLARGTDITFKNVTIQIYARYSKQSEILIPFSNNFKDVLPKIDCNKIIINGQRIPVLYKDSLADLVSFHDLPIVNSQVYEIRPGAFKNLQVSKLNITGNNLEEIREGVFNNLALLHLDLSNNNISNIEDGAFDNMPLVNYIYLAHNKISAWNKNWFQNTRNLWNLRMRYNFIEELPQEAFENWKGNYLDIGAYLDFDYNNIKTIHRNAFKGIKHILSLNLEHNLLENFDGKCLNNVKIFILRIGNNNIVCLQGDYEVIFKARKTILGTNPFNCQCLNQIKIWVDKNKKDVDYSDTEMNCTMKARYPIK